MKKLTAVHGAPRPTTGFMAKSLTVALATLALLGFASAAEAGIIVLSFDGTVTNGTDSAGLFGAEGTNLLGDTFSFSVTYDTSAIATALSNDTNGSYEGSSGTNYANYYDLANDGAVTASITIGGTTFSEENNFSGSQGDVSYCSPGWCGGNEMILAAGSSSGPEVGAVVVGASSPDIFPTPAVFSSVAQDTVDSFEGEPLGATFYLTAADGTQEILTASATPEPGTWFSMVTGIGLIALTRFRRRRADA